MTRTRILIGTFAAVLVSTMSAAQSPTSDVDAHIPIERVEVTAEALGRLDAAVDLRIYPGMGHTVNEDELRAAQRLLAQALAWEAEVQSDSG